MTMANTLRFEDVFPNPGGTTSLIPSAAMYLSRAKTFAVVALFTLLAAACTGEDTESAASDETTTSTSPDTTTSTDGASDTEDDQEGTPATLDWSACEAFECASLDVPLDHEDPDGQQIEIAVSRLPASGPAEERIGSLVFNPGGPGGSGIEFLETASIVIPPEVAAQFDLVGFDPRGVGASTAVDCDLDLDDAIALLPADDDAAWQSILEDSATEIDGCPDEAMEIAAYVGTNNAARDLDLLRAALGDEKLSYVGYSYGTRLGATYAELFPENVRALVLDAAVDPSDDADALNLQQAEGFDLAFENFAAACDADSDCLLQDIGPTIDVFRAVESEILEQGELSTDDEGRVLTPGEFYLGVIASLYNVESWPFLDQALFTAETLGDGTLLQVLTDSYNDRQPDGSYANQSEANLFINCADDAKRSTADEIRALGEATAEKSQYFTDAFRATSRCLNTPDPIDPLIIGPAEGSPPILVIGNTGDPATPYQWSVSMAEFLDNGVLFSVDAEGHTAYGSFDCVTPTVNAYLIDLEVPEDGANCSENDSADYFPPEGESEIDLVIAFFACLNEQGIDVGEVDTADILADPAGDELFQRIDINDPATATAIGACQSILTGGS